MNPGTWALVLAAVLGFPLGYVIGFRHGGAHVCEQLEKQFGEDDRDGKD